MLGCWLYTPFGNSCPACFVAVRKSRKSQKFGKSLEHFPLLQPAPNLFKFRTYMAYCMISSNPEQRALYVWRKDGEIDQIKEGLHELLFESPSLLLVELGEWLAIYHDQPISTTALHDNLKDLRLTYKRLKRVAAERDDEYRSDWLHNITANYSADQLVFLDESSKDDRTILRR